MNQEIKTLTLLFADISRSSQLYTLLGDQAAQKIIGDLLNALSDVTLQYRGEVVKTVGDAVICTFQSTDDAVEAAKTMQQTAIFKAADSEDAPPVNIHIGLHHGSVVIDNKDTFGEVVNVAARVTEYAKPRQIVATREVIDNLPDNACRYQKYLSKITAKNISGGIELFEIIFDSQQTTMTMALDSRKLAKALYSSLYLTRGFEVVVVDINRPIVSVGREAFNDIVVRYSWISRTHAYIENRNGIFMINDKSTNGTYIYPCNGDPIYINKGEHPLSGQGTIVLGRDASNEIKNENDEYFDTLTYQIK